MSTTEECFEDVKTEPDSEVCENDGKRLKILTEKGREQYHAFSQKYIAEEERVWTVIENMLLDLDQNAAEKDLKELRKLQAELKQLKSTFHVCAEEFISYLKRTNTAESISEMTRQEARFKKRCVIIDNLSSRIEDTLLDVAESLSQYGSTVNSVTMTPLTKKRLKAEAEKTKLAFIRKEVNLQNEKLKIEGELQVLGQSKSTAIAEAEVRVLEQAETESRCSSHHSVLDDLPDDKNQRVADYVDNLSRESSVPNESVGHGPHMTHQLDNATAPSNIPRSSEASIPRKEDPMEAISNFLLRKEILLSRFSVFNDEPEAYNAWKINFTSVVRDLKVNPFEEMQLLVRWLGPESSKHAADIQQANAENPNEGLKQIWSRLDERYGAIELIDNSLKTKIAAFPPLSVKDFRELYKLSDLLTQIDGVKRNPRYSAAFSYYDTSVGIAPIVNKLPYQWREKWISKAADYKERISVPYPPFSYFVKFIQDLCRVRNDPGFQFSDMKKEPRYKEGSHIRSRKTDVRQGPPRGTEWKKAC